MIQDKNLKSPIMVLELVKNDNCSRVVFDPCLSVSVQDLFYRYSCYLLDKHRTVNTGRCSCPGSLATTLPRVVFLGTSCPHRTLLSRARPYCQTQHPCLARQLTLFLFHKRKDTPVKTQLVTSPTHLRVNGYVKSLYVSPNDTNCQRNSRGPGISVLLHEKQGKPGIRTCEVLTQVDLAEPYIKINNSRLYCFVESDVK